MKQLHEYQADYVSVNGKSGILQNGHDLVMELSALTYMVEDLRQEIERLKAANKLK
jgi:hypothetical protein